MDSPQARLFKYLKEVLLRLEGCTFPHWIGLPADFHKVSPSSSTLHILWLKSAKGVNLSNGTKILWIRDVMYIGHEYWKQNCSLFNNTLFDFRHKFWQKTTIAVKTGKWVGKTLKYVSDKKVWIFISHRSKKGEKIKLKDESWQSWKVGTVGSQLHCSKGCSRHWSGTTWIL